VPTHSVGTDGPALPNVTAIDLAFEPNEVPRARTLEQLLAPGRFPNLRQLQLGREEPGARALFPRLSELAIAPQLTHLTLPSLRSRSDLDLVQRAIDALPGLHVVDIARAYSRYIGIERDLRHASARIRLPPVTPWPPPDTIDPELELELDTRHVELHRLIELMESHYAAMPEPARDAWDRVWYGVSSLGVTAPIVTDTDALEEEVPAATLHAALAALESDDSDMTALREELADLVEAGSHRPVRLRLRY
jgi:hypothetical protein